MILPDPATLDKRDPVKRLRARKARSDGQIAEWFAERELQRLGVVFTERVHTPWRIHRNARGKIINATPVAKVSGDIRGLIPGGRSVLCETKMRPEPLRRSALAAHQAAALDQHSAQGGFSLVAWVVDGEVIVMQWAGMFCGCQSLTLDAARALRWQGVK